MRKASAALFSHLTVQNPSVRVITAEIYPRNHPRICNITRALLITRGLLFPLKRFHPYQFNPTCNLGTFVETPAEKPLNGEKVKVKSDLLMEFESAKTTAEMLEAFKEMEGALDKGELGTACLCVAMKLDRDGKDPENTLSFATKALDDLSLNSKPSFAFAKSLQLMGSACFQLKKFNDSLTYLNKANKALDQLGIVGSKGDERFLLHLVQLGLANVKTALGKRADALENLNNYVEMKEKEKMFNKNSKELGVAYRKMADALTNILNFKEALSFCLKALETHQDEFGDNSVEVAHDRQLLGVIYKGLGEHNKALEQNELSQKLFKKWDMSLEFLRAEMDNASLQIDLGNHAMATDILKLLVPRVKKDSEEYALVLIIMGNALYHQGKFTDTLRCLDIASELLKKKETVSPVSTSNAYIELALQYETMNRIGNAVSILKRAFSLLEKLPQEQHSTGSVCSKLGWLLLSMGKESEAIPYLESGASKLEESLGKKHFGIGYVYNNLGNAYLKSDMPESAVPMFIIAKNIMTTSLGSDHIDTIKACQNLAKGYAGMKIYSRATEIQVQVIQSLKSHGPEVEDDLDESILLLDQITKHAPGLTLKILISKEENKRKHRKRRRR